MTKQKRKTRSREFFSTIVPVLVRGIMALLLLTQQAWAGNVCCGTSQIEVQQSCHQVCEEHCSVVGIAVESADQTSEACCQISPLAEPQPLIVFTNGQTLPAINFAPVIIERPTTAQTLSHSLSLYRSRPIFLLASCFLI